MSNTITTGLKLVAIAGLTLSIVACATPKPPPPASTSIAEPTAPPPEYTPPSSQGPVSEGPSAAIPGSMQDFVISAGDRVFFDTNEYTIRPDAADILAKQAEWLSRYPAVRVRVEGNCDERGTREYNFALGARRANSVRDFLVAHGVDGGRIATVSYGKERPIDPGDDESAWAKDRNGHTQITDGAAQ
jgi:peptidoglycan-associated lipoprotein